MQGSNARSPDAQPLAGHPVEVKGDVARGQMNFTAGGYVRAGCITVAIFAICALLPAQSTARDSGKEESLKKFLRGYVSNSRVADDRTTRYAAAFVDLKEDGTEEAIVYLMGPLWCGSGGCSCLVLLPAGESYKVVTKTTITQPPIRLLSTKTNGWHDLGVWVKGGPHPGFEAKLKFNGKKYPSNPSVPPAQRLQKGVEGRVVIAGDAKGKPLYGE